MTDGDLGVPVESGARIGSSFETAERTGRIRLAGMLHDVGKVGVPDSILNKPAKLTDEEFEVIKRHPGLSALC